MRAACQRLRRPRYAGDAEDVRCPAARYRDARGEKPTFTRISLIAACRDYRFGFKRDFHGAAAR